MTHLELYAEIATKGSDKEMIAEKIASSTTLVLAVIDGMKDKCANVRFGCEKVLRCLSQNHPKLVYPYFDRIVEFLTVDNKIMRWGATVTLANLAGVDSDGRLPAILDHYLQPIPGPDMITAANIIGSSPKIARAFPHLAESIMREILKVETAVYKTDECRNVAIGQAIDALDSFYDLIADKSSVVQFVTRQLQNTRKSVVIRAKQFIKKR